MKTHTCDDTQKRLRMNIHINVKLKALILCSMLCCSYSVTTMCITSTALKQNPYKSQDRLTVAVDFVGNYIDKNPGDYENVSNALAQFAKRQWYLKNKTPDDIAIIMVFLETIQSTQQ